MSKTLSKYATIFDNCCTGWTKDKDHNLMFLKIQENYANELLKSRGWLFLRDVYQMLGIPITKESCIVGWIYEENNQIGDNFVIFDIQVDDSPNIVLDFNVDGSIIERL